MITFNKSETLQPSFNKQLFGLLALGGIISSLLLTGCGKTNLTQPEVNVRGNMAIDCGSGPTSNEALVENLSIGDEYWLERTSRIFGDNGLGLRYNGNHQLEFIQTPNGGRPNITRIKDQQFVIKDVNTPLFVNRTVYTATIVSIGDGLGVNLTVQGGCK